MIHSQGEKKSFPFHLLAPQASGVHQHWKSKAAIMWDNLLVYNSIMREWGIIKKWDGLFVLVHVDVVAFLDNHRIPLTERYSAHQREEGSFDNTVEPSEGRGAKVGEMGHEM